MTTHGSKMHAVPFTHGQYQVGPFDKVVHAGEAWTGPRVVMSFYLNLPILKFFCQKNGLQLYKENLVKMYKFPQIVEDQASRHLINKKEACFHLGRGRSGQY